MSKNIDHVLLTRFNLPSPGYESTVRSRDGWLEQRVGLFEKYCLPSVAAQTEKGFAWIVYFDPASPAWLIDRIDQWKRSTPIVASFRSQVHPSELLSDIAAVTLGRGRLLTTNLDNDDALAIDFVERVQAVSVPHRPTAVYLANGLIAASSRLYFRTDRSNAFCSVSAPWTAPQTCWADWHNRLGKSMPVSVESGAPAWLQIVHSTNVSNRVHGRLVSPRAHQEHFSLPLDGLPEPTASEMFFDAVVDQPLRIARQAVRTAGKGIIILAAGQEALDRVRTRLRMVSIPGNASGRGRK